MEPVLKVNKLKKEYSNGTKALNGIDFTLHKGEFVVIIGPSGAGKSTLLRSLNRLVEPTEGEILFKGKNIAQIKGKELRSVRREIGIIFQSFNLVNRVSVLRNVLHGRLGYMPSWKGALGLYSKKDIQTALEILQKVGLHDKAYNRADELSGGQKQRVAIARALIQKPQIMLADEPIASLDPKTAEAVMSYLQKNCIEERIPCVVNLHQVDIAKRYATRIIAVRQGEIVFDGKPNELTDAIIRYIYDLDKPKQETREFVRQAAAVRREIG